MNRLRFRRILGISALASVALTTGCIYGFKGGGGFPADIHTLYVEPFENQTAQVELDQQLFRRLTEKLPRALGIRTGGQDNADAVISGKITRYDNVGQNYVPGSTANNNNVNIVTNQVTITVSVQIVDRKRNVVLWESQSLVGRGEYRTTDQQETDGREIALNHILQQIIDGAQSQW